MEKNSQNTIGTPEKNDKVQNIRVTPRTWELLSEILKKVNGKERGRSVKADGVVALALSFITAKEIKELQEASLTNADRLDLSYQKFIQENSFISKDEWLGRLLKNERLSGTG